MKLGTVAWGWTFDPLEEPIGDSLHKIVKQIADLKFDTVDLIGSRSSLRNYYTDKQTKNLREYIEALGLEISGFVSSTQELNHPDKQEREKVIDDFNRAVEVANGLGTGHINLIVPYPAGYRKKPNVFRAPADKFSLDLPENYSWQDDWKTYVESMHRCVDTAVKAGLRLSIECFPYTICSTPHAWLALIKELNSPNFGIQLDTAHLINQRHDVITAIHMLKGRIFHVHCKDSDSMGRGNLPPGSGIVDYTEVVHALRTIGYDGILSIEVERTNNPYRYVKQAREHIIQCLNGTY